LEAVTVTRASLNKVREPEVRRRQVKNVMEVEKARLQRKFRRGWLSRNSRGARKEQITAFSQTQGVTES